MSKLDALLRKVGDEELSIRAQNPISERLAARFRRFSPRPRSRAPAWAAFAAALVFAAAFFVTRVMQQPAAPLAVTIGQSTSAPLLGTWLGAAESKALPLDFSDGSRVELAAKSRARVVELADTGARVQLASGSLQVHVIHGGGKNWRIEAGHFGVHVTGTRFVVSYSPESDVFELSMEEGEVELSGCVFGQGRKLAAGQRVRASCRTRELAVSYRDLAAADTARAPGPPPSTVPSALPVPVTEPTAAAPRPSGAQAAVDSTTGATWFSLAKARKYGAAYAAADRAGFEDECRRATSEGLSLLAEVARHARAPRRAEQALLALRHRFPGTSDAALAAFALGRLEFDDFGAFSRAADWFKTYLRERPRGDMAREALGRWLEASYRAGDEASAQATARRYLREYPSGPHAELASRLASTP